MKKINSLTSYLVVIFALVSLSLFSTNLAAISPYVQVSTFKEAFTNPSSSELPEDWSVRVWQVGPEMEIAKEHQGSVLKLQSHQSNVALYKKVHVDLDLYPNLLWEWKVTELPVPGDARDGELDDQAAGIYVMFPRFPEFFITRIIGYVWESGAPQGTVLKSHNDSRIHYVVMRSGKKETGEWIQEMRNVGQDYEQIFGEIYFSPKGMVKVGKKIEVL